MNGTDLDTEVQKCLQGALVQIRACTEHIEAQRKLLQEKDAIISDLEEFINSDHELKLDCIMKKYEIAFNSKLEQQVKTIKELREIVEHISKTDIVEKEPGTLWFSNWRNKTKEICQKWLSSNPEEK